MPPLKLQAYAPSNITHIGKMAACDLHLASAAWNLPCVNDSFANVTYPVDSQNRTFTRATLSAGYISNIATGGPIEHKDNLLIAEFTVTALEDVGFNVGDAVYVGATVEVDNTQLWVSQKKLIIVKDVFVDGVSFTQRR